MTFYNIFTSIFRKPLHMLSISTFFILAACGDNSDSHDHAHSDEVETSSEYERGPNRGRMLRDNDFSVEITIFETGVPPKFHVYPYLNNELIDPNLIDLRIELGRLDGDVDHFAFNPESDYLSGAGVVIEPHSFDVRVFATYNDQQYKWSYASYEGRTTINEQMAIDTGIKVEAAGSAVIERTLDVLGRVDLAPGAEAILRARFPGQVVAVYKTVGESVKAGESLASVESNESLQTYEITSPIDGVVLERFTNVGNVADREALFVVGDLTKLQVDFHIFPKDLHLVSISQQAKITSIDDRLTTTTKIQTFLPTKELETQTVIARALLSNSDKQWMPGMTVRGDIIVSNEEVPLAVKTEALQRFRDFTVVFAKVGETYEVRMLELGRRNQEWVEVLGGIKQGQEYVTKNSFLIKADIEKSGASHDH